MAASKRDVEVEPRTVYAFGKRKARVWDARLGRDFRATAPTKAAAIEAVLADATYVESAGTLEGHGCKLYAQGAREWCFVLPSGGAMCFGAVNLDAALARVASDYADHEGCVAFFAAFCRRDDGSDDAAIAAADSLDRAALVDAAHEGATLGMCDEDS
jgi:hypothetical protein